MYYFTVCHYCSFIPTVLRRIWDIFNRHLRWEGKQSRSQRTPCQGKSWKLDVAYIIIKPLWSRTATSTMPAYAGVHKLLQNLMGENGEVEVKRRDAAWKKKRKWENWLKIIRTFPHFNLGNCNKNCLKGQSCLNRNKEINYIIVMAKLTITRQTAAIWASTIFAEDQVHQKMRELKTESRKNVIIVIEYPSSSEESSEPAGRTQTERLLMFLLQPNTPAQ